MTEHSNLAKDIQVPTPQQLAGWYMANKEQLDDVHVLTIYPTRRGDWEGEWINLEFTNESVTWPSRSGRPKEYHLTYFDYDDDGEYVREARGTWKHLSTAERGPVVLTRFGSFIVSNALRPGVRVRGSFVGSVLASDLR